MPGWWASRRWPLRAKDWQVVRHCEMNYENMSESILKFLPSIICPDKHMVFSPSPFVTCSPVHVCKSHFPRLV